MPDRSANPRPSRRRALGGDASWAGHPDDSSPSGGQASEAADVERLRAELDSAQAQAVEHLASLQRTAADFANYRRRTAEDRERELGLASEQLLRKLLSVADDFDRALEAMPAELQSLGWIEGIVLLDRKLRQLLESEGVTPIEVMGRPFDPREHEAIASVPAPGIPDGVVVAEIQRGYRIRDRVLRPAMVAIAGGGAEAPGDGSTQRPN
ncbi:MAG TPA: nucleotide exchange factor GrpE [Candidatus Limnocylindrales bacterium]